MPLPFPLQMQLQTLLKAPLERAPLFSKVSFRKKRTLNGVLYLNWLSESILLATLLENSFQAGKYFMREFLILVLKVKSHSYFSLFCGLHLTVIADDFKGLFFLAYLWLGMEKGASFLLVTPEFFTSIPYLGMWTSIQLFFHPQFSWGEGLKCSSNLDPSPWLQREIYHW